MTQTPVINRVFVVFGCEIAADAVQKEEEYIYTITCHRLTRQKVDQGTPKTVQKKHCQKSVEKKREKKKECA
jgi:hypothetical protein